MDAAGKPGTIRPQWRANHDSSDGWINSGPVLRRPELDEIDAGCQRQLHQWYVEHASLGTRCPPVFCVSNLARWQVICRRRRVQRTWLAAKLVEHGRDLRPACQRLDPHRPLPESARLPVPLLCFRQHNEWERADHRNLSLRQRAYGGRGSIRHRNSIPSDNRQRGLDYTDHNFGTGVADRHRQRHNVQCVL